MGPLDQQQQVEASIPDDSRDSRTLFSEEAFEPTAQSTTSNAQQALPLDERPTREEFVIFLHDLADKYDSHKNHWQYYLNKWVEGGDRMQSSIDWNSVQRAERDPRLTKQERNFLGIVKRNYDTFQYLNPYTGSLLDGHGITSNRIEAFRELEPNSERRENIIAGYNSTRIKTLGIRASTDAGADSLEKAWAKEYDKTIKPKIETLLNELKAEPTKELLALARGGNPDAQLEVAKYYIDGVESYEANGELGAFDLRQLEKALPWLDSAARQGNNDALYILAGKIGENTICTGPAKNAFAAVQKFFENQANGGDSLAKEIVQCLKEDRRNEVAAQLYKVAAAHGDESSIYMLGQIVKGFDRFGDPLKTPISAEAQHRYAADIQRLADEGNMDAVMTMGELYELGAGVPKDTQKAAELYRQAAEAGNKAAQLHMGIMHYEGGIVDRDMNESARWFKRAGDVVEWQLHDVLKNQMGRAYPSQVFDGVRSTVSQLPEATRKNILEKIKDDRRPYDNNIMEFAKKAASRT
ncbi:MAG: sel1 repeat family protein [Cyanobacteria bacterium]|nr:sel1 repeat family protein [Cyanobacteriota bacterium]